jgi:hypothetical protein
MIKKDDTRIYMVRDPRAKYQKTDYKLKWSSSDTESWTPEMKALVPDGIDPTDKEFIRNSGIFFVDAMDH